jgi:hypothetical protein
MRFILLNVFGALFALSAAGDSQIVAGQASQQSSTDFSAPKEKAAVSGRVTNAQTGEALKKANVHLRRMGGASRGTISFVAGSGEPQGYGGTSELDGSFRFEGVEPGDYILMGDRFGYISTQYGSKGWQRPGVTLKISPGQNMADLKLELLPQCVITGRVVDEDGDPAGGVNVQAMGRLRNGGRTQYFPMGNASTDDTGAYRLAGLNPGKFYVTAQSGRQMMGQGNEAPALPGKPDIRPASTYYPDALSRTSAIPVELTAGQSLPGVDIRLRSIQTFHVAGKVVGNLPDNEWHNIMISMQPTDEGARFNFQQATVDKSHGFDFQGVTPGSYELNLQTRSGKNPQYGHQAVEVGAANVNDVVLTLSTLLTLHGVLELEGASSGAPKDKSLANIQIILFPDSGGMVLNGRPANSEVKPDGTFTLENVSPTKMRLSINNEPDGAYIKSIRFNQQEVSGKQVDLSQSSGGELRIVLRYGGAEVDGTVQTSQDASSAPSSRSMMVALIPDGPPDSDRFRIANTNQNGGFTIRGLTPGLYHAIALEPPDQTDLQDPALQKQLIGKATDVEVKENDKRQLQLTLLPADDVTKAVAAAGSEN